MTQEQAAAAIHAAKLAQLNAMGRNLDKLPANFLHPQLDISKINSNQNNQDLHKSLSLPSVTIEPALHNSVQKNLQMSSSNSGLDIRKNSEQSDISDSDHPQNLINNNNSNNNNNTINSYNNKEESSDERNISDDESIAVN